MIAWKRGLSLKFRLATTNSKWSIEEKIKHLLKCLSGYVELAKLLQKPENKMRSSDYQGQTFTTRSRCSSHHPSPRSHRHQHHHQNHQHCQSFLYRCQQCYHKAHPHHQVSCKDRCIYLLPSETEINLFSAARLNQQGTAMLQVVVMSLLGPIHLERNPVSTQLHCHKVLNTLGSCPSKTPVFIFLPKETYCMFTNIIQICTERGKKRIFHCKNQCTSGWQLISTGDSSACDYRYRFGSWQLRVWFLVNWSYHHLRHGSHYGQPFEMS